MLDPTALVRQHAAAIVDTLVQALQSPDGRVQLMAAKRLLDCGWGPSRGRRPGVGAATPDGSFDDTDLQRVLDTLRPQLRPAATSVPDATPGHPGASPENTPLAEPLLTPCPAAAPVGPARPVPPNPGIDFMSRENGALPPAARPATDSPRGDAHPMSRAVLPAGHSEDAFRRRLPVPPPVEPPGLHGLHSWPAHRPRRWT